MTIRMVWVTWQCMVLRNSGVAEIVVHLKGRQVCITFGDPDIAMASTISSTSSVTPADSASSIGCFRTPGPVDPDVRRSKGKTYRRVRLERPKKPRTGWWWGYGCEWDEVDTDPVKYYWICAVCESWHAIQTTSSQHIRDHLAKTHRIADPANTSQPSVPIRDAFAVQAQKREPTTAEALEVRRKKVRKTLLEWIAHDRIAFSAVESSHFQAFCEALDPAYATVMPLSHNSVRTWLISEFELKRADITTRLATSRSMVHISFDLWTSPHKNMAVLGVVAHFMNADYTNEAILLALRRIEGTHSGQNVAEVVLDILRKYQIHRLGYFVCDNASSNDTAILGILKSYGLAKEKDRRRLRCLGHIVNLAAQAFLFGKDTEAFEESDLEDLEVVYKLWQQAGPVGQVHFLVAFIRASSQRREDFARLQGDEKRLQPLLDNKTRWNSTWNMLKRATLLRKAINLFCLQYIDSKDLDTSAIISDESWDLLDEICSILELFDYATEKLQGAAKDGISMGMPSYDGNSAKTGGKSKDKAPSIGQADSRFCTAQSQVQIRSICLLPCCAETFISQLPLYRDQQCMAQARQILHPHRHDGSLRCGGRPQSIQEMVILRGKLEI